MFEGVLDLSESAAGAIRTVTADRAPSTAASRGPRELQTAEQELERFVTQALEGVTGTRPRLVAVLSDRVAEELVEQSRGADLLVIGTRGRGGVAGLLLGSVAHQCIRLGTCPLLILPPTVE
jgi:nucleotide-binding universal stress UspA family protein